MSDTRVTETRATETRGPETQGSETQRVRRFGWWSLLLWALLGLCLEAAHGFKLSAYLDDELTRMLLRLGHAHGVGLSLLVLVYGSAGLPLLSHRRDGGRAVSTALMLGAACLPLGFALGAIAHPEGDPGIGVVLAPVGGLALLWALLQVALSASRQR